MLPEPPKEHQRKRLSKYISSGEKLFLVTSIGRQYFWISLFILMFIPLALTYYAMFAFFGLFEITAVPWLKFVGIAGFLLLLYDTPKYSHLIRMRQSYTYALTSRRFLIIRGIFSRKIVTAPLTAITHVTVEQNIFQRLLFNSGHLVIITAGFDQREIVIENVGDPLKFKIIIEELTEKLESDRGSKEDREDEGDSSKEFSLRSLST